MQIYRCYYFLQVSSGTRCSMKLTNTCEVSDSIASCRGIIQSIPNDLPKYSTELHLLVTENALVHHVILETFQLFPTQMPQLRIFTISLLDRTLDKGFQCKVYIGTDFFSSTPHLSIFRIATEAQITFQEDSFLPLKQLRVLDLTRTKNLNLTSFIESIKSLKQNPLETLILKNVQGINKNNKNPYLPDVDISKIICTLSETLRTLDLSHNDILTITMTSVTNCIYRLRSVDLRYNIIVHFRTGEHSHLTPMLLGAEIFYLDHMWDDRDADVHLWHDNQQQEEVSLKPINSTENFLPASLKAEAELAGYLLDWMDDMREHCPRMNKNLLPCFPKSWNTLDKSQCSAAQCLFLCTVCDENENEPGNFFQILGQQCDLTHCFKNTTLPLFFLKEFHQSHNSGRHSPFEGYMFGNVLGTNTLCFYKKNNLEILDISFSENYDLRQSMPNISKPHNVPCILVYIGLKN